MAQKLYYNKIKNCIKNKFFFITSRPKWYKITYNLHIITTNNVYNISNALSLNVLALNTNNFKQYLLVNNLKL